MYQNILQRRGTKIAQRRHDLLVRVPGFDTGNSFRWVIEIVQRGKKNINEFFTDFLEFVFWNNTIFELFSLLQNKFEAVGG